MPTLIDRPVTFRVFGPDHLVVLALVVVFAVLMIWTARRSRNPRRVRRQEVILGLLLLARYPASLVVGWGFGLLDREALLPFHLCDLAAIVGGVALLTGRPLCAELTYFWGIAGTLNGLITPPLQYAFPHPAFFMFFWLHAGVVLAAAYLVGGAQLSPRPGAVRRVTASSLGYMAFAGVVNWLLGTNYGFLCGPPARPSLIDLLGPWPWYLLSLIPLGIAVYAVLYFPFYLRNKFGQRNA
jgi:hypothetical integral membrane protein (TIGR02206 family)